MPFHMCLLYIVTYTLHYLNASPMRAFTSRLPSTFMCHIYFSRNIKTHTNNTVLVYIKYIYIPARIFSLCVAVWCVLFGRAPISFVFCFHLTPLCKAILCSLYVCNLKRLTKMDILRIKESNNDNNSNNN